VFYLSEAKIIEAVVRRLDVVINVLLETTPTEGKRTPLSKRIQLLYSYGLRPSEISKILAKDLSTVTKELTRIRRASTQGKTKGAKARKGRGS